MMNQCRRFFAALLSCILLLPSVPVYAAEPEPIRIAFLDSGISLKHLDAARVEAGENLVFPGQDTDDRIGHGTATAGIVLGSEELGLPSLCPEAVVVPLVCYDCYPSGVKVQGNGETLARAIRLAVDRYDCRIINISMGMTEDDPALREAVEYALAQGTIIVSAVGNQNETAPERVYYPAAYDGVIGVGAADGEQAADFSQRNHVDVLANGVGLPTATNRNSAKAQISSGTSYSCAIVSALCAAIWAAEPELSADEVCERLYSTAKDVGEPGFDTDSGWGIVSTQPGVAEDTPDTESTSISTEAAGEVTISVPQSAGEIKVEIPVENVTSGTVAVIVKADGTEEIVKASIPTENGLVLAVEGTVTVKIVDNTKEFVDVCTGHWSESAIDFVTARGMFEGTSATTFSPNSNMTRAMLMTVLARFDGVDTTGGVTWYDKGMNWAMENGVSDGSNPGDPITREQLAVMLWRYTGSPTSSHSLDSYTDAAQISDYAQEAMRWANENGILNGYGNSLLGAKDNATRAQVAQMLMNFLQYLSNSK